MGLGDAKLLSVIGLVWLDIYSVCNIFSSVVALMSVIPDLIRNKKNFHRKYLSGFIIIGNLIFFFLFYQIKLLLN